MLEDKTKNVPQKKGNFNKIIVFTIILVSLSIVGFLIFLSFKSTTSDIVLKINSVYITPENDSAIINLEREGKGKMTKIEFSFYDFYGNSYLYYYDLEEGLPVEGEVKTYRVDSAWIPDLNDFLALDYVSIAYYYINENGEEVSSSVQNSFGNNFFDDIRDPDNNITSNPAPIQPRSSSGGGGGGGGSSSGGDSSGGGCSPEASSFTCNNKCGSQTNNCGTIVDCGVCTFNISSCVELQNINNNLAANYNLVNDINCNETINWNSGLGFKPIGENNNTPFIGNFNGNGHIVSNLYINRSNENYIGLFGVINSTVSDVGVVNANIKGNSDVGALVGYNEGTVTRSYSTGNVSGNGSVGGLVGFEFEGSIFDSYSDVTVISFISSAGGLVGVVGRSGVVGNSYSTGNVIGRDAGGLVGLVGGNPGLISNSYSTGNVIGSNNMGGLFGTIMGSQPLLRMFNVYWNNHSGNSDNCYSGGDVNCSVIQNNFNYFKNDVYPDKQPFSVWDFASVWEEKINDYPVLRWQGIGNGNILNISCNTNSDCPANTSTGFVCSGDNVNRTYFNYTCINPGTPLSLCVGNTNSYFNSSCLSDSNSSNYCRANNPNTVYYNATDWSCPSGSGSCTSSLITNLVKVTCSSGQTCSNGACVNVSSQIIISFVNPTPANNSQISTNSIKINTSISSSLLDQVIFNWNNTNYTLFNDSIILMLNLDNRSSLGENSTRVVDVSGKGNNGNVIEAVFNSSGKYNGAYSFDGVNDYINIGTDPALGLFGSRNVTISMWVYMKNTSAAASKTLISKGGFTSSPYYLDCNSNLFRWRVSNVTNARNVDSSKYQGNWIHIVMMQNQTAQYLYINNTLIDSAAGSTITGTNAWNLTISTRDQGSTTTAHNGSIDEVMIFNRSLSAFEIQQLYFSNLNKYNSTQWYLYNNQSGLSNGNYSYQVHAVDSLGAKNSSEKRNIRINFSSIICSLDSACGTDGLTGVNFCNSTNGNVYRNFTIYTCISSLCGSFNTSVLTQPCLPDFNSSNYCRTTNQNIVYYNKTDYSCMFGACTSSTLTDIVNFTCPIGEICSNGGCVTSSSGISISTCQELQDIQNNLSANYALLNDIDCSITTSWDSGKGFKPVGNNTNPFIGNFNGNGHVISNLYINRSSENNVGLFGGVGSGGKINNIGLTNIFIIGNSGVGGIVGGFNRGNISNSYVIGILKSSSTAGGIVGINDNGNISNSYSKANITGNYNYLGGLVGYNNLGTIVNSYSSNNFVNASYNLGGLVGYNNLGTIVNSYSSTSVFGFDSSNLGGNGAIDLGGLVGKNNGAVLNCYSTGNVNGDISSVYLGGLIGRNDGFYILNSYWNNFSGNPSWCWSNSTGQYNINCTAINNNQTYFYTITNSPMSNWDFVNVWSNTNNNLNYPILKWQEGQLPSVSLSADFSLFEGFINHLKKLFGYS